MKILARVKDLTFSNSANTFEKCFNVFEILIYLLLQKLPHQSLVTKQLENLPENHGLLARDWLVIPKSFANLLESYQTQFQLIFQFGRVFPLFVIYSHHYFAHSKSRKKRLVKFIDTRCNFSFDRCFEFSVEQLGVHFWVSQPQVDRPPERSFYNSTQKYERLRYMWNSTQSVFFSSRSSSILILDSQTSNLNIS